MTTSELANKILIGICFVIFFNKDYMVQRDYVFKRDTGDVLVWGEKLR